MFGIASLIGKFSGKILDVVIKSSFCCACSTFKSRHSISEYTDWYETHKDKCTANHHGSAGKMEVDAVQEMFLRSEELLGVRYEYYIGDGDTKTFKAAHDKQPYEDLDVKKRECVGHVQKRMSTRLRKLKHDTKGLGGKGTGKLTDKIIGELTTYYGLAIRRNPNSQEHMKEAIWATYLQKSSTDDNPQHKFCPEGEKSWCKWRVAEAEGTLEDFKHDSPLQANVLKAIKPIYEDLSRDDLLQRCLGGNTQNTKESFNATVWKLAPKYLHNGSKHVQIATYVAASVFNEGSYSVLHIMGVLGIPVGPEARNYTRKVDNERIKHAERRISSGARAAITASQRNAEMEEYEDEGLFYGAGIAD